MDPGPGSNADETNQCRLWLTFSLYRKDALSWSVLHASARDLVLHLQHDLTPPRAGCRVRQLLAQQTVQVATWPSVKLHLSVLPLSINVHSARQRFPTVMLQMPR